MTKLIEITDDPEFFATVEHRISTAAKLADFQVALEAIPFSIERDGLGIWSVLGLELEETGPIFLAEPKSGWAGGAEVWVALNMDLQLVIGKLRGILGNEQIIFIDPFSGAKML